MDLNASAGRLPGGCGGFSVIMAERVLHQADVLGLDGDWAQRTFGNPSGRVSSYRTPQRIAALLAGLACGLHGIGPGNTFLRPNTALQCRLGGRFPDQGTIHRWLDQVTELQAQTWRDHLHQVARVHGRFQDVLRDGQYLFVDVDGQGLPASGPRFEGAARGYLGEGLDTGYQRYVCYVGQTREVLDEFLAPGNKTLMSQFPQLLAGLDAVVAPRDRRHVVVRGDAHLGTIGNVRELRQHGYHYMCPLQSWAAVKRLREHLQGKQGGWFDETDSSGKLHHVQFWVVPRWRLSGKGKGRKLVTRATVYRETQASGQDRWTVLVSDLKREKGRRLWQRYHERGGTIEEYNDQSERAYHLEVLRSGNYAGLNALHSLIGLCWNLTQWALESLQLPPVQAPTAAVPSWLAAVELDLAAVQDRAAHSGLRLDRSGPAAILEVEDTAQTAESTAWCRWLRMPIQLRLRFAG